MQRQDTSRPASYGVISITGLKPGSKVQRVMAPTAGGGESTCVDHQRARAGSSVSACQTAPGSLSMSTTWWIVFIGCSLSHAGDASLVEASVVFEYASFMRVCV